MLSKRLYGAAMMAAVVIPSTLAGCSDDGSNPLCCTEFKVGATISGDIGGSAESKVAVQAVADFSGIASAAIDDLTAACRTMAQDLGASTADQDAAAAAGDRQKQMTAWCDLAVKSIGAVKAQAGGTLRVVFNPPVCEASISAKANCQASCSGSAKCDLKANPPKCTGGKLEVSCKGSCELGAKASISCEGKCEGTCKGECTASGGVAVDCDGKCEGTCAAGGQASGSGIQADGSCKGTCQGTCTARAEAPAVSCTGSCKGECNASCTGTAEVAAKCDGECKADFEPLKCEGGKLEGGCQVEAKCDANCDASVSAKAECRPPEITVELAGSANIQAAGKLKATLEANLGIVAAFQARLDGMIKATGSFSGNITAVTDIKAACILPVGQAVANALGDVNASFQATGKVVGSVGG